MAASGSSGSGPGKQDEWPKKVSDADKSPFKESGSSSTDNSPFKASGSTSKDNSPFKASGSTSKDNSPFKGTGSSSEDISPFKASTSSPWLLDKRPSSLNLGVGSGPVRDKRPPAIVLSTVTPKGDLMSESIFRSTLPRGGLQRYGPVIPERPVMDPNFLSPDRTYKKDSKNPKNPKDPKDPKDPRYPKYPKM